MSSKFEPPKFIDDASGYPEYKKKLQRWSRITKVDVKQQAEVVLYHLEGHSSGIQEKIDTALGDEVINKDDGLTKLITFLDGIYAEDEMTEAWTKYKKFIQLKKDAEQPITEFIAEFDKAYTKAKESGCEFSDTVLAFNLLEACTLSDTDEKFILTAVDFKKGKQDKNLLEQIKNSLRKFQSRERLLNDRGTVRMQVKEEDTFISSVKNALIADGWCPPSLPVKQNLPEYKGKKNPLGTDGKPLKCFQCQSEYHLMDKCDERTNSKKDKHSSKSKRKDAEDGTMLSKVLARSKSGEYVMMCHVYENPQDELVLVSYDEEELCLLVEEAGCRGVLDSACSRTVAGLSWVEKYANSISSSFVDTLPVIPSSKVYQFGGGEKRKSQGSIKLPTVIGDKKVFITMDVVDAAIPLLIGSNAMEAAGAILNFQSNTAIFFDEDVAMSKVGTGHFCIDLISKNIETHINEVNVCNDCVQNIFLSMEKVDKKELKKLHHFYGHTSADRLLKFLKNTGKVKAELSKIEKSCEACTRTKRRKPIPRSAVPRVEGPNEIVTIDLKQWKEKGKIRYICYMIDMHSRLTVGSFIPDKKPDSIVQCIMRYWVPVFGLMQGIHSDIGGEFSNTIMDDVAHKLGVKLTTTSSNSPHQNGLNERNHSVVDMMITRMMYSDKNLSSEMALLWALNAKNSLENCFGFTPFQLHIGRNPVLPSTTRDGPPSYGNTSKSKSFAEHLNTMHSAREEFIKAESSASLKKALKSKLHPKGDDITEGDWIYYKKDKGKSSVWSGPSKVVSTNGKKLFVDQGVRLGTVNRDYAVRKGEELWKISDVEAIQDDGRLEKGIADIFRKVQKVQNNNGHAPYSSSESESEDESAEEVTEGDKEEDESAEVEVIPEEDIVEEDRVADDEGVNEEGNEEENVQEDVNLEVSPEESEEESETESEKDREEGSEKDSEGEDDYERERLSNLVQEERNENAAERGVTSKDRNFSAEEGNNAEVNTSQRDQLQESYIGEADSRVDFAGEYSGGGEGTRQREETAEATFSYKDICVADVITYRIPETGVVETSKVLSRAAKMTGPNKFWWNVEVEGLGEKKSIDTAKVKVLCKVNGEPPTVATLVVSIPRHMHNEPECVEAKQKELENWDKFGVYVEIEDCGQKTLNTNWVLVRKVEGIKARLCIRGDQEPDKETIRTDSPTVNKINIKLFYLLAAYHGWKVKTADVKAAFLQGADLERDVFVRPPKERRVPGVIWKMIKRTYGFVDASRGFYLELNNTLIELGCKVSLYDPALYMYFDVDNCLKGMLLTHVDDLIHGAGDEEFYNNVLMPLKEKFKFGREEEADFRYVGMHVKQEGRTIITDQNQYVEDLDLPDLKSYGDKDLDSLLDDEAQTDFRAAVGRIGWVANSSRPDLSYDHLVLSIRVGKATLRDMKMAIRVIKKMKCDGTTMKFVNVGPVENWTIVGYGDAGFKSLPDKTSSCGGHVILLSSKEEHLHGVLNWKSNKIKRVVSSSTAAEALAANDTLDEMVYIRFVLWELLGDKINNVPLVLHTDSKNLHKSVHTSTLVENPRLRTDIAKLKESLKCGELSNFTHVTGKKMIADVLTKKGAAGFGLMNILRTGKL